MGRVIRFLQFRLRRATYVRAGAYVEDIHIDEPDRTADSGFEAARAFRQVTGFGPESAKCLPPNTTVDLPGAQLTISPDSIRVNADMGGIHDIDAKIGVFIKTNSNVMKRLNHTKQKIINQDIRMMSTM